MGGGKYCYDKEILAPADGIVAEVANSAKDILIFPKGRFFLRADQNFYNSAGLPIQFRNIDLSPAVSYEKFDSRPHMACDKITEGYITRGFAVRNRV